MPSRRYALLTLPFIAFACFSPDTTSQPAPDSGLPLDASGSMDASLQDTSMPDTSMADSMPDVPVDTAPLPVTITVLNEQGPEMGVAIVFDDASGAVIATGTTDAAGRVVKVVPAGSQVTALMGTALAPQLVTITAIQPGDMLTAIDVSSDTQQASIVAVPASPPTGTTTYNAYAGVCYAGFNTPTMLPAALSLRWACESGNKFPLLVMAADVNNVQLGFTFQKGTSLVLDGGTAQVSATGAWSTALTTQTMSISNVPMAVPGTVVFTEVADGVPFPAQVPLTPTEGTQTSPFIGHTGYPDFVQGEASIYTSMGGGASYGAIATRSAAPTTSGSTPIDLAQLLPYITSAAVTAPTAGRPSTTWTTAASLASTDGAIVVLNWNATGDAGTTFGTWTIVGPPSSTTLQAPALPSSAAAWTPAANASYGLPTVAFVQAPFFGGYTQMRAQSAGLPLTGITSANGGAIVPPLPSNGTLKLTAWSLVPS